MVLHKAKHVGIHFVQVLPHLADFFRLVAFAKHALQGVVQAHFIVEVIEACIQKGFVKVRLIDFRNHHRMVVLAQFGNHPLPKCHRHHLGHIHTEAIDIFAAPKTQNLQHLLPSVVLVIVQLDRVVPIVDARVGGKHVVACGLGRELFIRHLEA